MAILGPRGALGAPDGPYMPPSTLDIGPLGGPWSPGGPRSPRGSRGSEGPGNAPGGALEVAPKGPQRAPGAQYGHLGGPEGPRMPLGAPYGRIGHLQGPPWLPMGPWRAPGAQDGPWGLGGPLGPPGSPFEPLGTRGPGEPRREPGRALEVANMAIWGPRGSRGSQRAPRAPPSDHFLRTFLRASQRAPRINGQQSEPILRIGGSGGAPRMVILSSSGSHSGTPSGRASNGNP